MITSSHKTGKIRGYICHNCNIGLGNFRDHVKALGRAIEYPQTFLDSRIRA